jgi:glyoxylase-like metal-dependent hydrolase (beta-lactamase superfamily II)
MHETSRLVMMGLDLAAIGSSLVIAKRAGVSTRAVGLVGVLMVGWLAAVDLTLRSGVVPAQLGPSAFLALVIGAVGLVGGLLLIPAVRAGVARLGQADLLRLQGVRVAFGVTFLVQAVVGVLPRTFGLIDGVTHTLAGALGVIAAASLRRAPMLAWVANLFGLLDIVVVLSSLAFVLLPEITAHHPMMYAVFVPAPFWAWWHVLSLAKLRATAGHRSMLVTTLLLCVGLLSSCRPFILRTVMTTVDPYFHGPGVDRVGLDRITAHVYSFQWNWYRNLVILTSEGLVVIDPMGLAAAAALKEALATTFPGVPVQRVIYSHYHLDHVSGAALLHPREVIAHRKCLSYWEPLDRSNVMPPTRVIAGDTDLSMGGITVKALDLGLSHTDTLYAFWLPDERVLFTADLGLVKTVAPAGVPDRYAPGYLAALDRLSALDFDHFVPSHFGFGTKQDLIDWRDMVELGRTLARKAITKGGTFGVQQNQMGRYFDEIYYPMRERYGAWHGFDEMVILNIVRDIEGEGLGH